MVAGPAGPWWEDHPTWLWWWLLARFEVEQGTVFDDSETLAHCWVLRGRPVFSGHPLLSIPGWFGVGVVVCGCGCQVQSGREHLFSLIDRVCPLVRVVVVCLMTVWPVLVCWSSCQGRTVDAWASGADEGRGRPR